MAEIKTKPSDASVDDFIQAIEHPQKRADAFTLKKIMEEVTGEKAVMWGPTMIGFGTYHYQYASGHGGDFFIVGFSPRKAAHSLYLTGCMAKEHEPLMQNLGKYKSSVSCLYVNKLSDLNESVLRELISVTYHGMKSKFPDE
jgi:hypothetical protein